MISRILNSENIPTIYKSTQVDGSAPFAQNCKKAAITAMAITFIAATGSFFIGLITVKTALYTVVGISTGALLISVMVNEYAQKKWFLPAQPQQQPPAADPQQPPAADPQQPPAAASGSRTPDGEEVFPLVRVARNSTEQLRYLVQQDRNLTKDDLQVFQDIHTRIQFSKPLLARTINRILGNPVLINGKTPLYLALQQNHIKNPNIVEFMLKHKYHYSPGSRLITEGEFRRFLDIHLSPGAGIRLIIKYSQNRKELFQSLCRVAMVDDASLDVQGISRGSRNIARTVALEYAAWHRINESTPAFQAAIVSDEICGDVAGIIAGYCSDDLIDDAIIETIKREQTYHLRQIGA